MVRCTLRRFLLMKMVTWLQVVCANVGMDSVLQVMIYVTDRDYLKTVNQVYAEYFEAPYPNRAALVIAGLAREEMLVELVVYAAVP